MLFTRQIHKVCRRQAFTIENGMAHRERGRCEEPPKNFEAPFSGDFSADSIGETCTTCLD